MAETKYGKLVHTDLILDIPHYEGYSMLSHARLTRPRGPVAQEGQDSCSLFHLNITSINSSVCFSVLYMVSTAPVGHTERHVPQP